MLYDDMQGHDSQLEGVDLDVEKATVSVHLLSYPEWNASKRVPVSIFFESVTSLALNAALNLLASNRSAGNVNHWHIAEREGTSHIYLAEGYIAISSEFAPRLVAR